MTKPTFLIPGAQKCGTSTIHALLRQHPDCFMPEEKEPQSFAETNFNRQRYVALFEPGTGKQNYNAIGEASTSYMITPGVPELVRRELGGRIKFIFMLRDPVDRTLSSYLHMYKRGHELRDWNVLFNNLPERESDAVAMELAACNTAAAAEQIESQPYLARYGKYSMWPYQYLHGSLFSGHIERYLCLFPENQCLFVFLEQFKYNPLGELQRIFRFLDLDDNFEPAEITRVWNRTVVSRPLPELHDSAKKRLVSFFRSEKHRLAEITGERLPSAWER